MNALIAGKSDFNPQARDFLANRGVDAIVASDVSDLKNFEGEAGKFTVSVGDEKICVSFAVLTENTDSPPSALEGFPVNGLFDESVDVMASRSRRRADLFLLDHFRESPAYATVRALESARFLSLKKREVYFLSRFVRTADYESEELYAAARNAGVIFVEYESLDIGRNGELLEITASDGILNHKIIPENIYSDGARDVPDAFRRAAAIFRLRTDAGGYINEDRYFLPPVRTSRRGVYHIGRAAARDLESALLYVIRDAGFDAAGYGAANAVRAVVDGNKCVLCYTCWRTCPHAAMSPDADARAMKNLVLACEGCGICVSLCPCNAITLSPENPLPVPNARAERGKILMLCCENSAYHAVEEAMSLLGELSANIDACPIACGGRVSFEETGTMLGIYGGVMAAVCHEGACRHFDGGGRACLQTGRIAEMLRQAGISGSIVGTARVSHAAPRELADAVSDFFERAIRSDSRVETTS
ncbi:MAG: hydrogenase iron-sulfur subunit [Synergistaceae bacterium]|jgi:Pyruvate/2-oxoacid:ferredoxin oxidoreductase delta subunit/coenzyme F420-reducing hydrogenase delta subunit|nr:hydrogenase iron-sulfur subunit [Synergistaceae bacterium]